MIATVAAHAREATLSHINTRIVRDTIERIQPDLLKTYIVVTPHLIHFAPLAVLNHGKRVCPVFVSNGLSRTDVEWLHGMCPHVSVIPLRASLLGNRDSLLAHGTVVDYLAECSPETFCIQDADCFITDSSFWDVENLDIATEYAACPFVRNGKGARPGFPETFLTWLNAPLLRSYRRRYGITSESRDRTRPRTRQVLAAAGYPEGKFLEELKDYYDTLQQFWVVASHNDFSFREIAGAGSTVHHIGGTSYLHRSFENLDHWDYWPLAVHYFNLRILEFPSTKHFSERFARLIEFHGSADDLLRTYPQFAGGWRHNALDRILVDLGAKTVLSR